MTDYIIKVQIYAQEVRSFGAVKLPFWECQRINIFQPLFVLLNQIFF